MTEECSLNSTSSKQSDVRSREMAAAVTSNQCSICQKTGQSHVCGGCKAFFCGQHFTEHHQQLLIQFDREVVRAHDELCERINKTAPPSATYTNFIRQIDQWETATIAKINSTAEQARHQLIQLINDEREILTKHFKILSNEIQNRQKSDYVFENVIEQLREKINELQQLLEQQTRPIKMIIEENNQIDWNQLIYFEKTQETTPRSIIDIPENAKWTQNGVTVAGGNQQGKQFNQLCYPWGLCVDDDQTVYVADYFNHRIVEWKCGAASGQVVAGGNGQGNRNDQLNNPAEVIVDKETDSLIICDRGNGRVVRWSRRGGTCGQTIISGVDGYGLMMDNEGFLYVSDSEKHEVKRWRMGETSGTVVAGGNGKGDRPDQLNYPSHIFVDRSRSVYVSDSANNRVMQWCKGAKRGVVVAGGHGLGCALTQLTCPRGVLVDQLGTIYVADCHGNRIMRWLKGATQGSIIVGKYGKGEQANQIDYPKGLSFDSHGNLYVVDYDNHRVQRFSIGRDS